MEVLNMQDENIIVKLWEQSYTKGNWEYVTVKDLKQFAQVCDKVNDDQNKVINKNSDNIVKLLQLIENQKKLINQLQTQVSDLTNRVETLENAKQK